MMNSTKCAALALLAGALSAITAEAVTNVTCDVAARLGYQTSEQILNGAKITEWSSPLVGVEGTVGFLASDSLKLECRGVFDVLFDSGTLYADSAAGTDYTATQLRLKGEGYAGWIIGNTNLSVMPFVGLGYRTWSWSDPDPTFPHIETWSAVYGLVGARGDVQFGSAKVYGRIAVQIPVKDTVTAEGYERTLEHNSTTMVEAELGMVAGRLLLGLWGEWFNYSSDNLPSVDFIGYAEDVTITTIGVKIGAAF